ncbi:MAG: type II toxin-antitoxin system VapB family antitoxin, partial [Deltaproteobacteria bacterium]
PKSAARFRLPFDTSLYTDLWVEWQWSNSMRTNLAIDDRLINEAVKLGHHRTKKEAVTAALDEYVRRRKQLAILD